MCKHGEYALMNMEIEIDKCLVPLIKMLQEWGIKTRACCCGHGEKVEGKKINNHVIISAEGVRMGIAKKKGKANGWKNASDFDIWGISIPIEKRRVNREE